MFQIFSIKTIKFTWKIDFFLPILMTFFFNSKKPKKPQRRQNNRLKPLTLAYDGDADM